MKILVVGAGIAGTTLAYWLRRHGLEPTLLERAPAFRTGGYVVDFWGAGFDVAERMGLVPALRERGYSIREVRMVGARGERVGGFGAEVFSRMTNGRYTSIPRGDLAAAIGDALDPSIERIFGDELTSLQEDASGVTVTLARRGARRFDLVVGADGLHSSVRALALGPSERFEKFPGYQVAAFTVDGYRPRDPDVYVLYGEPGQQVGRFTMRGDRTLFLFVWRSEERSSGEDGLAPAERVRARFSASRWEVPAILDAVQRAKDPYVDRVSQIEMERWTRGRVALVGDAAYCVSLLAGQGSALAMAGAYVLAGELARANGDHARAFAAYEERLAARMREKQAAARRFAGSFAPSTALGVWVRNHVSRLLAVPWLADRFVGADIRESIALPSY